MPLLGVSLLNFWTNLSCKKKSPETVCQRTRRHDSALGCFDIIPVHKRETDVLTIASILCSALCCYVVTKVKFGVLNANDFQCIVIGSLLEST